ncbi:hypothetical protein ACROSR_08550 [Roseovarius tibetensis]|uniref:hypothetical protein n=1 Tax=Roseovarius tibetensis TaxID=2685897 RepID=UPI003D7FAAFE
MFGPDVYFRLFELHNHALWLFPIIAALTGAALPRQARAVAPRRLPGMVCLPLRLSFTRFRVLRSGVPWHRPKFSALPPDPTAIACLGMLSLVTAGRWTGLLVAIPLLWCGVGAATLLTLGEPQAWILIAAVTM